MLNKPKTEPIEQAIFWLISLTILLSPIPLGSNRPIFWSAIALIIATISALYFGALSINKARIKLPLKKIQYSAILYIGVVLWIGLQYIINIDGLTNPFWYSVENTLASELNKHITVSPHKTIEGLMLFVTYGFCFLVSLQMGASRTLTKQFFNSLIFFFALYITYAFFIYISGNNVVVWQDKYAYFESMTGTFINRNSFSTYLGIGVIITTIFLLKGLYTDTIGLRGKHLYRQLLQNLGIAKHQSLLYLLLSLLAGQIMTNSRAGIVSTIVALVISLAIFFIRKDRKLNRKNILLIAGFTTIIIAITFMLGDNLYKRFNEIGKEAVGRPNIYAITSNAISDFAYSGSGLGSFEEVFRVYRDNSMPRWKTKNIDHAHSSYLEIILEIGIFASLALFISITLIVLTCLKGVFTRERDYIFPLIGVGISILVWVHALVDFSIEMPAIALTYAGIMGFCVAQSFSSRKIILSETSKPLIYMGILLSLGIFCFSSYSTYIEAKAYHYEATVDQLKPGKQISIEKIENLIQAKKEIIALSNDAKHYYDLSIGQFALAYHYSIFSPEGRGLLKSATENLKTSLSLAPLNPYAWNRLAYASYLLGGASSDAANYLYMSVLTGPFEPFLIHHRVKVALIFWNTLTQEQKETFKQQIRIAHKWDHKKLRSFTKTQKSKDIIKDALY